MPELGAAWSQPVAALPPVPFQAPSAAVPASYDYAFLYHWQQEAPKAWHSNARRGVVEAVTGSGKTRVGIAAAFEAVRQGIKVLILVPTAELQRQWLVSIRRDLPTVRRGALGDGRADSLDDVDILVAIVHSASSRETLRSHKAGLIIAEECHRAIVSARYPAERSAAASLRSDDDRSGRFKLGSGSVSSQLLHTAPSLE